MLGRFNSNICNEFERFDTDDEDSRSSSDTIDSDIEFHLYSQVHYSSNFSEFQDEDSPALPCRVESEDDNQSSGAENAELKIEESSCAIDKDDISLLRDHLDAEEQEDFIPETWEIVDSVEDSDDENVEVHFSEGKSDDEPEVKSDEKNEDSGSTSLWKIDNRDKKSFKMDSRGRYYGNGPSRAICRNCNETGHLARDCTEGKKQPVCFMCGERGHIGRDCPEKKNHKFANRRVECNRCQQQGHLRANCPDLWRQYHMTTDTGPLIVPEIPVKLNKNVHCYNCAGEGHFGYECEEPRQSYCPVLKPLVHRYDEFAVARTSGDLRNKLSKSRAYQEDGKTTSHRNENWDNAKRQQNKRITFQSSSEDEPPAKCKQLHGGGVYKKRKRAEHHSSRCDSRNPQMQSFERDISFHKKRRRSPPHKSFGEKEKRKKSGKLRKNTIDTEFDQPFPRNSRKHSKHSDDRRINDRGFRKHF